MIVNNWSGKRYDINFNGQYYDYFIQHFEYFYAKSSLKGSSSKFSMEKELVSSDRLILFVLLCFHSTKYIMQGHQIIYFKFIYLFYKTEATFKAAFIGSD